ncbi:MAG: CusA/CzcA family heavy metal efflux RND transporter [Flavobacteriaceae bacterium]
MLSHIIRFSVKNKFIVLLMVIFIIGFGLYSLTRISIGAVPDITNNQVQVITTSRNLSAQDMEKFITYPVELEMANLPGVLEIRSVSKFGLSVVTIVFEDEMGNFLPRQLIAEKLETAADKIPEGFGVPEMGPITTGLGEIYQYILDVEEEYKNRYTPQELRTIQDWIVKRQLSGIPGVVEVNTWGGHLKQYEIALNTQKLMAMEITALEVFSALENNNSVAGGGYIEKDNQAYFIRGEGLVSSLSDIEEIVVKNINGIPIYVRDIANVGFGNAIRFGAITGNGEGEKVLGQVMMLKNANSKKVIDAVKQRVDEISHSLPEGVYINGFLDRSELIAKTTQTVTENLILGCLIVIFVVLLILGNIRSGLVVASVIPLSLLFALTMMYFFDVDANLMSLGAIDFGIIIDGAVIIVEFIAFRLTSNRLEYQAIPEVDKQAYRDSITLQGASNMMNSAIFGQLIILIVFIPILSLSGVEGKMFKPMALTFGFALIGAILLCFTYIPVMSALFLKPEKENPKNISIRLMSWIENKYKPIIESALERKKWVLTGAAILVLLAGIIFSRIGGEFIPTLDEGDFVIQPVFKTGTSLSKTVALTTQIENILLEEFPEVEQVVTRIGAAEVPTDPMSMEESDVIIRLAPKSKWVTARNKDALAEKFKEALEILPTQGIEFTQPIEMRFNELITGVRADIAIKIFGEDLGKLSELGNQVSNQISNVDGAADIVMEKIEGLPTLSVRYDRHKIARYGLNIKGLNDMISMAFAGRTVGSVYEGEKRFDMVVRLNQQHRQDLENLENLYVDIPAGIKVPLGELAQIRYEKGAAKISRDNTRRRVVVGVNVRNRDLESVVNDIQTRIGENIDLPAGYTIAYGGQFENLQSAKSRLRLAVPIALFLIFVLLYFAFRSVKEALMIFTAIPLAAVGGIFLLWARSMPFSISAGIGFIALFGIAVLNGIVLIEHFKELKKQEFDSMKTFIVQGTRDRLRAVLLTASAAALGFLPMAVSTSAGAEVQRPLATVVIGGLVTATVLTLFVLPVLYSIYSASETRLKLGAKKSAMSIVLLFCLSLPFAAFPQEGAGLQDLMNLALENNSELRSASLKLQSSDAREGTAFDFGRTEFYFGYDENNIAVNGDPINVFGLKQEFLFPTVYGIRHRVQKTQSELEQNYYNIKKKELLQNLYSAYNSFQITREKVSIHTRLDSLYREFARAANRRFELGETNYLEKITALSKQKQIGLQLEQFITAQALALDRIVQLVQSSDSLYISPEPARMLEPNFSGFSNATELQSYRNQVLLSEAEHQFEKQRLLPDINLEYFQGSNEMLESNLYGYQIGLKIPLLFNGQSSRIKAAGLAYEAAVAKSRNYEIQLETRYKYLLRNMEQNKKALSYYLEEGNSLADEILKTAEAGYKNGEIDFFQYIQSLENAYGIRLEYLDQLSRYNESVISLNYLTQ